MRNSLYKKALSIVTALLCCICVSTAPLSAAPSRFKINSVKSLTYMLGRIEKENGPAASYLTLKLQIYLEDVYISQGTPIILKAARLSAYIRHMIRKKKSRSLISRRIIKYFQDGHFNE